MEIVEGGLARDLAFVLTAALLGGAASAIFRLPLLTGYIISGVIFAAIARVLHAGTEILTLAQLGIILLLFTLGIELSLKKIARVFQVAVLGGIIQILSTTILGILILPFFGITGMAAFVLAFSFSLSSTAVVIKLLFERSEIDTVPGEILSGWLLVQDLAVVPVVVLLPLLGGNLTSFWELPTALGKALSLLILAVVLGRIAVPRFLRFVASFNSREFLLLATASLIFATAALASLFGVSPALGAFVAGLVVAETSQNHAVFAEIRPLREIFMILFFVSLGALIDPSLFLSSLGTIFSLAVVFIFIKFLLSFSLVLFFGYHVKTAFWVGTGLANIGEFSFVLAATAAALGILDEKTVSLSISVTLVTLLLTPLIFAARGVWWQKAKVTPLITRFPRFAAWFDHHQPQTTIELSNHVILCGFGRMGAWLGRACQLASIPFVVIEYNHATVAGLRARAIPVIYGDPADQGVLESARVKDAKLLILAIPDRLTQELVIANAQTKNPRLTIISRAHHDEDRVYLVALGVKAVFQPEFEAALSIIHRILQDYGMSREEVAKRIKTVKSEHTRMKV